MENRTIDPGNAAAFLEARQGAPTSISSFKARMLRGGVESAGVWHITVQFEVGPQQRRTLAFIVKHLPGAQVREAGIYREMLSCIEPCFSPGLLWVQEVEGGCHLYLEAVGRSVRWPWREAGFAGEVLKSLARLHTAASAVMARPEWLGSWDYEAELAARGRLTIQLVEQNCSHPELRSARNCLPAMRRLVEALPELRRQLFQLKPFGSSFIHGDVHPGNVLVRNRSTGSMPVFLDWGRSRIGSPLEDVSSWLQSLSYWEPEARRRHDTLLATYLEARGEPLRITRETRDAYWLAAASNLLAGAILYHLSIALNRNAGGPVRRLAALRATHDCLRVIRRADACQTSGPACVKKPAARSTQVAQVPAIIKGH
jgi:hypothetical protein